MSVSSVRDTYFFTTVFFFSICFWTPTVWAEDMGILNKVSPLISLHDNGSTIDFQSFQRNEKEPFSALAQQETSYSPPVKKNLEGQDLFSLALGARFQISDWLDIGAACTMPLNSEEPATKEDLLVEAMVTMQF